MQLHARIGELFSGANFITLVLILTRVSKWAGRLEQIMHDFPPHRHVGNQVIFPEGFNIPREHVR